MEKISFNEGWKVRKGVADPFEAAFSHGGEETWRSVVLPHDAMIEEARDPACPSGKQSGFYPAGAYTYVKEFDVPAEWEGRALILEFEGVMARAMVYVNNTLVCSNRYGYAQFYADLAPFVAYGKKNTVKVIASTQEKSSRWYSGSGIYRPVNLYLGGSAFILPEGVRITTERADGTALISVSAEVCKKSGAGGAFHARLRVLENGVCVSECDNALTLSAEENDTLHARLTVHDPRLWSDLTPFLYTLEISLMRGEEVIDLVRQPFGIRTLALDAQNGLRVNGISVQLRGACIHHDNGILGAATYYDAEYFRAQNLKRAGFNAIRSAHNPLSKEMLRACDELGIYVMDELTDMWNEPKNANDYSLDFGTEWKEQCRRLVGKDYNHPSVILYSLGNEIPEIGRASGARMNRMLAAYFRELDHTRYLTNAISGFLAVSDALAEFAAVREFSAAQEQAQSENGEGSEGMNNMMGKTEQEMLDSFATSPILTRCVEEVACELDVVGFNYLTARHAPEKEWHPGRVIVGSETYPTEIARLWKIVKENPHVIGDFSWTGYDYLGEAGIGIFHYNAQSNAQGWYPDRLAYTGDIDISAYRRPVSYLREIVYGLRTRPYMAVFRPEHEGEPFDKNNWKYHDVIESWTFAGFEGKNVRVLVLSPSEEVELRLNGKSVGRKEIGTEEAFTAIFSVPYMPGTLEAVAYTDGKQSGSFSLKTAGAPAQLLVWASKQKLPAGEQGVAFITCELADREGVVNRMGKREVAVRVDGAGSLLGFGSANPSSEGSYLDTAAAFYDGRVIAAVRAGKEAGTCTVTFSSSELKNSIVLEII